MVRLTVFLCAIAASLIATIPGASARTWHRAHWANDGWRHHSAGGPVRVGNRCWVSTDNLGYGYYTWCPGAKHKPVRSHRRYRR